MNTRQSQILNFIIKDYIDSALPVGSDILSRKHKLSLSPATIRNEMAVLTDEGYIEKPHASAGRVPTEHGYRFFVDQILAEEAKFLARKILQDRVKNILNQSAANAVRSLSELAGTLVLYNSPRQGITTMGGLSCLLSEPEFAEIETAKRLIQFLERSSDEFMQVVRNQTEGAEDKPRVFVGSENINPDMRKCSVVFSSFHIGESGEISTIAIVGPLRMRYRENLALMRGLQAFLW